MPASIRPQVVVPLPWMIVACVIVAGCAEGPPPLFEPPRTIEGETVLLEPAVRLGEEGSGPSEADLRRALRGELYDQLVARGLHVTEGPPGPESELARAVVSAALSRARSESTRRLKSGDELGVAAALAPLGRAGARAVVFVVVTRRGVVAGAGRWVPLRDDELIELPDDRFDYEIPFADRTSTPGVDIELLIVDVVTGTVVTHRKLSHPAHEPRDLLGAFPSIVRNATRGLTGDP